MPIWKVKSWWWTGAFIVAVLIMGNPLKSFPFIYEHRDAIPAVIGVLAVLVFLKLIRTPKL